MSCSRAYFNFNRGISKEHKLKLVVKDVQQSSNKLCPSRKEFKLRILK